MRILSGQEEMHLGGLTGGSRGRGKRQTLAFGLLIPMVFQPGCSFQSESFGHIRIAYTLPTDSESCGRDQHLGF